MSWRLVLGLDIPFARMKLNPLVHGIAWDEVVADPSLSFKQRSLVVDAARALDKAKTMCFDEKSGNFYCTELGGIVINTVAHSSEFENIVVREEEQEELETLLRVSCPLEVKGGPTDKYGKISILIQILRKLEEKGTDLDSLYEMEEKDIGLLIRYAPGGKRESPAPLQGELVSRGELSLSRRSRAPLQAQLNSGDRNGRTISLLLRVRC